MKATFLEKKVKNKFGLNSKGFVSLPSVQKERAISSAGSEHLVYTEGVGGSNPSSPTEKKLSK